MNAGTRFALWFFINLESMLPFYIELARRSNWQNIRAWVLLSRGPISSYDKRQYFMLNYLIWINSCQDLWPGFQFKWNYDWPGGKQWIPSSALRSNPCNVSPHIDYADNAGVLRFAHMVATAIGIEQVAGPIPTQVNIPTVSLPIIIPTGSLMNLDR